MIVQGTARTYTKCQINTHKKRLHITSPTYPCDIGGETDGGGALARGVDAARRQLVHVAVREAGNRVGMFVACMSPILSTTYPSNPQPRHAPQDLGLGDTGVAHQQHVDLSPGLDPGEVLQMA